MNLPNMYRIRQKFDDTRVDDIRETVKAELGGLSWSAIRPGDRVAVTAGSRGIADITQILGAIVDFFKSLEAEPFLFPAMGSHGGATAEGQVAMLAQLGVTEASVKAPIVSSMETAEIGLTGDNIPVFMDKSALAADHIVVVNRIKSHTKFKAPIESGLMKMMAIGMGKLNGAELYHKAAVPYSFFKIITDAARMVLTKTPIICAVGILENAYGQTAKISVLKAAEIESQEQDLLHLSKKMMAKLPFNEIDLLIVDEMGKDISGVGIDPNITGRNRDILGVFPHPVQVKRLFVRDLTDGSKGNATGIGLADITTQRLVDKIDYAATYKNCITGLSPEKAAVPMHFGNDRDALEVALGCVGLVSAARSKIVRIKNTLRLDLLEVSEAYAEMLQKRPDLEIVAGPNCMEFSSEHNLL
jgi:hypothetical protein